MRIGFIGLGAMGGGMARNLVKAGFELSVLDLDPAKVQALVEAGARPAPTPAELVRASHLVMTSVSDSDALVKLAETHLLPAARPGQLFVDLTTVKVSEARRLAQAFAARNALMLDAPVSGGAAGAANATLSIFVGGDQPAFEKLRPVFNAIGNHVTYCGHSGMGQIVKGVNQMAMGLGEAAFMESVAFGIMLGADPAVIRDAVGGDEGWRKMVAKAAQRAIDGTAKNVGIKHDQLPCFLEEARNAGFELPISRTLHIFCQPAARTVKEANRWSPSFWTELLKKRP